MVLLLQRTGSTVTTLTPSTVQNTRLASSDDEGWPRARVCLVHVPSAVPVPVGFPTLLANTDRLRPSCCLVFQVLLVHHSFARDHTVAFLSARGQRNIQTSESPRRGSGNVHTARERPCDITREYDCFRYFALGRLFSRFDAVEGLLLSRC